MEARKEERPVAVVLYGMIAVGKLTIAQALQKKLGYRLTHNHLINDLVWSIFDRGTLEANRLIEKFRYELYEEAVAQGVSVITTHCYSHDYVSPTGLSDPDYLVTLEQRLEAAGARPLFVHLQADHQTLLERVQGESRRQYRKLMDVEKMREHLAEKQLDIRTSAPVTNNMVIDTTNLSPEEVAEQIVTRVRQG